MSAVKSKFAGLLRGLLRHFDDNEPVVANPAANTFEPAAPDVPAAPVVEPARGRSSSRPPTQAYAPAYVPQRAPAASAAPAKAVEIKQQGIELPLQPIIAALPLELRAKITGSGATGATISIPVEKVLTQLATGSVKISFGELRQMAPGAFANYGGEHDARSIVLPLNQVIAQINPALLARRAAQKQVEISDDVANPFDAPGSGLKISTEKSKATPPMPAAEPPPLSRFAPPVSQTPVQPPPVAPPPAFAPRWTSPATSSSGNGGNTWQKNVPGKDANVSNGSNSGRPSGSDSAQPAASPKAASTPSAALESPLLVTLAALFEGWPDALKLEITQLDLENKQVALPVNLVEPALKRGRVVFAWRDLRSWITSAAVAVSVHDGTELELPLKVLAPLFFARQKAGAAGPKKPSVTEEIPDLFFGSTPPPPPAPAQVVPPPPAAVAAAIPSPDTNYFTRSIQPPTSDSEFVRKGGTDFKSRGTAPADVVARAMEMPGVAGALVTLSDGLKVASQVPAELNGDTLAAFIPQIFARVSQGSRELRMGELNNLSFTVGSVAWKIFRVNAIYFAAFGRKNEPLPGASLAALAVQLDHKK